MIPLRGAATAQGLDQLQFQPKKSVSKQRAAGPQGNVGYHTGNNTSGNVGPSSGNRQEAAPSNIHNQTAKIPQHYLNANFSHQLAIPQITVLGPPTAVAPSSLSMNATGDKNLSAS